MKNSSQTLLAALSILLGAALIFTIACKSGTFSQKKSEQEFGYQTIWNKDELKITTEVITDDSTGLSILVGRITDDKYHDTRTITAEGDVMMHVDFVSDTYIGINVTDSVGLRPMAFVVNREIPAAQKIVSDGLGEYLAGAHDGQRMLMLGSNGKLFLTDVAKYVIAALPAMSVDLPGFATDTVMQDASFSPDDKSIVVLGTGFMTGVDSRDGERTILWVINVDDRTVVQIGQIEAYGISWEDNDTFILTSSEQDQTIVARYSLEEGKWIKE